ncbi:MAG TPA: PfkB family carbohydrate kinase [Micromonosporaceae bacterium]|jgi:sugar/nucleoside kinase (ribokinase family)
MPDVAPLDVLVVGGAGVDTIIRVPTLPLPYADSYTVPTIVTRAGHTGDNVAGALRRHGLRVHHLDVIGADVEGGMVRRWHHDNGVPFTALTTRAGTKRAVNLVEPGGQRLSLYDGTRSDPDDRFPEDLVRDLAARARHVHVSITAPGQHALPVIDRARVSISTDLHDWDGLNPYHETFARHADVVFLSATALRDVPACMRRILDFGRPRLVIATAGSRGGYLLTRDAPVTTFPAVPVPGPVVDSNGAGDAFVAAFLAALLADRGVHDCVAAGADAGARACIAPLIR